MCFPVENDEEFLANQVFQTQGQSLVIDLK